MPSIVIKKYQYEAKTKILTVEFVSGLIYEYHEVPESVFEDFRMAFAKGIFLNKNIKGRYTYVRKF